MTKRERLFDGDEYDCLMPTIYDSESSHAHKRKKMKKFIDSEIRRQIKAFSEEITVGYKANHWKSDTPMSDAINTALKLRGIKP